MKKKSRLFNLIFLVFLISSSCEDTEINRNFSSVPSVFTKKVLIEEFTGSWCGYCPSGAEILEDLVDSLNVIGVAIHSGDYMTIEHGGFLEESYPSSGYPSGMVDRISYEDIVGLNRAWWSGFANQQLQNNAMCGLAINSDSLLSLYLYPATIISLLPNKDNRSLNVNSRILFVRYGFPKLLYSDPS